MSRTWISKIEPAAEIAATLILALQSDRTKLVEVTEILTAHISKKPRRKDAEFDKYFTPEEPRKHKPRPSRGKIASRPAAEVPVSTAFLALLVPMSRVCREEKSVRGALGADTLSRLGQFRLDHAPCTKLNLEGPRP
jgi:hypothetical protein